MIPDDAVKAIDWLRVEPATDDRRGTCGDAVLMLARAEIERLRAACKFDPYGRPVHVCEKLFNVTAERDQLRAMVAELTPDAERWRFARAFTGSSAWWAIKYNDKPEQVDAAIDEARAAHMKESSQ